MEDENKKKVIFLDRDGTMNVDHGYVHKIEDWEWHEGAIGALKRLKEAGYILAVVTNQSGIGHGMYTQEQLEKVHEHMQTELGKHGCLVDVIAFCPHRRDADCDCRKPKTSMIKQVEREIGPIDYTNSWTVGDKIADLTFGKSIGSKTALIRSKYWKDEDLSDKPDVIVASLSDAANRIVNSSSPDKGRRGGVL